MKIILGLILIIMIVIFSGLSSYAKDKKIYSGANGAGEIRNSEGIVIYPKSRRYYSYDRERGIVNINIIVIEGDRDKSYYERR